MILLFFGLHLFYQEVPVDSIDEINTAYRKPRFLPSGFLSLFSVLYLPWSVWSRLSETGSRRRKYGLRELGLSSSESGRMESECVH